MAKKKNRSPIDEDSGFEDKKNTEEIKVATAPKKKKKKRVYLNPGRQKTLDLIDE